MGQGEQALAPTEAQVPAAQDEHALIDILAVDGLYVPAAQDKHALIDVLPVDGLYVPCAERGGGRCVG